MANREEVFNSYRNRSTNERIAFIQNRINALLPNCENMQVLPTEKLYTKYIGPKANCLYKPDQGSIHVDSNDFYIYAFNRLLSMYDEFYFDGIMYPSLITRIANEYFGSVPTEEQYREFTRGKNLSIADFKGKDRASAFERALVINNFSKIIGYDSSLVFMDGRPSVMIDSIVDSQAGHIIFTPDLFTYARRGSDAQTIPAIVAVTDQALGNFLYGDYTFASTNFTDPAQVEKHIPGYTLDDPAKIRIKVNSLHLPREMSHWNESIKSANTAQMAKSH